MEEKLRDEFIKQVRNLILKQINCQKKIQTEMTMVKHFLNTTHGTSQEASNAAMALAQKLELFKEIRAALWVL